MSTFMAKAETVERKWYVLDAAGKPLGRTAATAAMLLRGKHKPQYAPNVDCGDHVIIINAEKIHISSNKRDREMRVDTQPGCKGKRIVRQCAEENGNYTGNQRGCCCNLRDAQSSSVDVFYCADDQRVQQDNICHGEERHRSRADFSSNAGTTF